MYSSTTNAQKLQVCYLKFPRRSSSSPYLRGSSSSHCPPIMACLLKHRCQINRRRIAIDTVQTLITIRFTETGTAFCVFMALWLCSHSCVSSFTKFVLPSPSKRRPSGPLLPRPSPKVEVRPRSYCFTNMDISSHISVGFEGVSGTGRYPTFHPSPLRTEDICDI